MAVEERSRRGRINRDDSIKKGRNNIEMLALHILQDGDCYGYQLTQLIQEYSKDFLVVPEGSLYPALYRLIEGGYITDRKEKVGKRMTRVYYHLEPSGVEYLKQLIDDYNHLNEGIQNILQRERTGEKKGVQTYE